jgi:hypothetical protein
MRSPGQTTVSTQPSSTVSRTSPDGRARLSPSASTAASIMAKWGAPPLRQPLASAGTARVVVEQAHAHLRFKARDRAAQRRLRSNELRGRAGEAAFAHHRQQGAQVIVVAGIIDAILISVMPELPHYQLNGILEIGALPLSLQKGIAA